MSHDGRPNGRYNMTEDTGLFSECFMVQAVQCRWGREEERREREREGRGRTVGGGRVGGREDWRKEMERVGGMEAREREGLTTRSNGCSVLKTAVG